MKKIVTCILSLVLTLSLAACGSGGNTLFDSASPSTSVLSFYVFDGEHGFSDWISDVDREREILAELGKVKAKPVEKWTATYPMYGLSIGSADGMGLRMLWTNGYLITRTGEAYRFDYDFAAAMEGLEWGSPSSREAGLDSRNTIIHVSGMPNARYLALQDGEWNTQYLRPAGELKPPKDISMGLVEWTEEKVSVTIRSDRAEEWCYGEYFHLEVLLDGTWYMVPQTPDENWGFTSIGIILQPYDENEESYSLSMYGELPPGSYRLVVEGMAVEGEVG